MSGAVLSLILAVLAAPVADSPAVMHLSPSGHLQFSGRGVDGIAESLAQTGDEDRAWAAREVGSDYDGITEVRIARDPVAFAALQPAGAVAPPWASGVAYPDLNIVVLRVGPRDGNPRGVLRHELSHIAVGRLTHGRAPHWLLEGLATIHSGDAWSDEGPSLVQATLADSLFSFEELSDHFPSGPSDAELAYAQSASFVQFLINRIGEERVRDILRALVQGESFDAAVVKVTGATPRQLEKAWRRSLSKWEMLVRVLTSRELFWGALAVLCLVSGWMMIRRRRRHLATLAREEQDDVMHELAQAPAVWADRSNEDDEPSEPEDSDDDLDPAFRALEDDETEHLPDHYLETPETTPKKPTLH